MKNQNHINGLSYYIQESIGVHENL